MSDQSLRVPITGMSEQETRTFGFTASGQEQHGFILKLGGTFRAYVNRCPHWNVDLDMDTGDFISENTGKVICRNHGALFEPHSGLCVLGPCVGKSLQQLALSIVSDAAVISIPS